jgi:hypothetical protein
MDLMIYSVTRTFDRLCWYFPVGLQANRFGLNQIGFYVYYQSGGPSFVILTDRLK